MPTSISSETRRSALVLVSICALMVAIHIVNSLSGSALDIYGVRPRQMDGLTGVVATPWLHEDWGHLGNNLVAMAIFGALVLVGGVRYFVGASAIIILLSGLLLWLLGRGGVHIGASGWVFGLWSLVIARGWYDRNWRNIAIAIGVIAFYGGMVVGVLPTTGRISFEGHLFGAVAGVVAAYALRSRRVDAEPAAAEPPLKFWS